MINELLKYQEVDGQLREIEKELGKSEERKKAVEAKKYLDTVEESVNKLDARAGELLLAYENVLKEKEQLEEQKDEFKKALEGIEDEAGANYLIKRVDKLMDKIKSATATLKKIMEEFNAIAKGYVQIKNKTKDAQEQYRENGQKYNEFKASFKDRQDKIKGELEQIKKKISPELMEKYQRKRENKMFPILYEVGDGICGRCNMEISLSEVNKLKNGEVIECQCGCLLYKN